MRRWMMPVLLAVLAGCSATMGMDRGPVAPMPEGQAPVIDNAQIAAELARRPQLGEHVRVGVYFLPPAPVEGGEEATWRWAPEERQQVVEAAEDIERFELFPIADSLVSATDLTSLRLAGARAGADAILVVDGHAEQHSRTTGWAATYPLILPIFFAPGGELETRFRSEATLYDVRNGFLYASAEAETEQSQHRAHVWLNRERGVDEARHEVAGLLTSEIARRLRNLEGAPTPEVTPTREADVEEEEASTDGAQPSSTPDAVGAEPVEPGRDEGVTEP